MRSTKRHYISGIASGVVSYILGYVATFLVVYFLTQLLTKAEYGTYAFLIALVQLVAIGAALGLNRALLYRVAGESDATPAKLKGLGYFKHCLKLNALSTTLAVVGFIWLGNQFLTAERLPGLGLWLVCLAPLIPFLVISSLCNSLFQANHRIVAVQIVPRLRDIFLAAGLAGLFVYGTAGPVSICAVLLIASFGTLLLWLVLIAVTAKEGITSHDGDGHDQRMSGEDIGYGAKLMMTEFTRLGIERVDIIMLGMLATAASTADYALSVKLAALVYIVNSLLDPIFTPRMRAALVDKREDALRREYGLIRFLTLTTTMCGSAVFMLLGSQILAVFGDFAGAHYLLITLTNCFLVKAAFGANGRYLNMAGYGTWTLSLTCLLLFMAIGLNLIMIPRWGTTGAAWATLLSILFVNAITTYVIYRKDNFTTISHFHIVIVTILLANNLLLIGGEISATAAAGVQLGLLAILVCRERNLWIPHAKSIVVPLRTAIQTKAVL